VTPRQQLQALAAGLGCSYTDLPVLDRTNDLFYAGGEADEKAARWFIDLWDRFGYADGVHIRRVHYRALGVALPDGRPYENTTRCSDLMEKAAKKARELGYVSPEVFVDRRNAAPVIFAGQPCEAPVLGWEWDQEEPATFTLPRIDVELASYLSIAGPAVVGYDYDPDDQAVQVEVWIEKSTMNDVLEPICQRHHANLVTSVGFQSMTNSVGLLLRAARAGKPTRVLYISDFDPAGKGMPVAVARQLEFWCDRFAPGIDVKLTPLALTAEQVAEYALPRVPIKEEDRRRAGFEETHGQGAVELDALEALYPGSLGAIVEGAIAAYREPRLRGRLAEAEEEAGAALRAGWKPASEVTR
jgi:hypothetical protein